MAIIEPVVAQMIMNSLLTRHERVDGRRKTEWLLLGFAAFLVALGAVYLAIALHAALIQSFSPVLAALLTAAAALALGSLSALVAYGMKLRRHGVRRQATGDAGETLLAALDAATRGLEEPVANNPRASMALAGLAGFLTANKVH